VSGIGQPLSATTPAGPTLIHQRSRMSRDLGLRGDQSSGTKIREGHGKSNRQRRSWALAPGPCIESLEAEAESQIFATVDRADSDRRRLSMPTTRNTKTRSRGRLAITDEEPIKHHLACAGFGKAIRKRANDRPTRRGLSGRTQTTKICLRIERSWKSPGSSVDAMSGVAGSDKVPITHKQ
jgi:hypothetical protein